jgi:flagellar basal body-associated protein FliL
MSEKKDAAPAEASTPAASSKKPLLIVGVAALAAGLGVGSFVAPRFLGGGHDTEASAPGVHAEAEAKDSEPAAEGTHEGAEGAEPASAFTDRIVQFEPFVVNVSGENYPRYLKLQVVFEMSSAQTKAKLEERVAPVRDLTISLLSSKRLADITDFEGKALLKDDLRQQVDELLGKGSVENVMFTEFVVQ